MNFRDLGMLGYGLQTLAFLSVGIASILRLPRSFPILGFDPVGLALAVPGLSVSLTWYSLWKVSRSGLYVATSVFGLLSFTTSVALSLWATASSSLVGSSEFPFFTGTFFGALALMSLLGVFALVFFVIETVSFFSAGSSFNNRLLRFAGWSRLFAVIAAVIIFVIAVVLGLLSFLSPGAPGATTLLVAQTSSSPSAGFATTLDLALGLVYVVLCIPEALAYFGFRGMKPDAATVESGSPQPQWGVSTPPPSQS